MPEYPLSPWKVVSVVESVQVVVGSLAVALQMSALRSVVLPLVRHWKRMLYVVPLLIVTLLATVASTETVPLTHLQIVRYFPVPST